MFSSITFKQSGNEMRRIEVVLRELERLTKTISRDDLALAPALSPQSKSVLTSAWRATPSARI
jgi:hypothetical protein